MKAGARQLIYKKGIKDFTALLALYSIDGIFSELRAKMSADSLDRSDVKAQAMLEEMPLNELRQARGLSQKMLVDVLHVQQTSIAKLEKRTDIYISTLRSHIKAIGGELEVVAKFPDGSFDIKNFAEHVNVTVT